MSSCAPCCFFRKPLAKKIWDKLWSKRHGDAVHAYDVTDRQGVRMQGREGLRVEVDYWVESASKIHYFALLAESKECACTNGVNSFASTVSHLLMRPL